jgi:serine protease Do
MTKILKIEYSIKRVSILFIQLSLLSIAFLLLSYSSAFSRTAYESFADLVDEISPAVVNITTSKEIESSGSLLPEIPKGSPLEDLFRNLPNQNGLNGSPKRRRTSALGSGFIISETGLVVTNNHVIEQADEILIELFSGEELKATLVGTDPKTDIALLKVEYDKPLSFVKFGNSDLARVGDWVMAVGNPLGQGFSVSAGIISARNRALRGSYDDFIQTDAAINRGNSGGPLFNMEGEVLGVNTAIISPNGGSIGIGFSMASNVVSKVVYQLEKYGETRRGWLGVSIQDVSDDIAAAKDLDSTDGALVTNTPDGPAKNAGVKVADVIISFDNQLIKNTRALVKIVGATEVGKIVKVTVMRNGEKKVLEVTVGHREQVEASLANDSSMKQNLDEPLETEVSGMVVSSLTKEWKDALKLEPETTGVVVISVEVDSAASEKGIVAGDLIIEANQEKVSDMKQFNDSLNITKNSGKSSILLLIRRKGNQRFLALPIK